MIDKTLGHHAVTERIGTGGIGAVYKPLRQSPEDDVMNRPSSTSEVVKRTNAHISEGGEGPEGGSDRKRSLVPHMSTIRT
jgi:hypothetical protein